MPGVSRHTLGSLAHAVDEAVALGIGAVALFPVVDSAKKTEGGEEAYNLNNIVCKAVRGLKKRHPSLGVMCDVALDPFTTHGQDGLLVSGEVVNDATLEVLVRQALVQAEAGCDILAPSDMMDGRVAAIRDALEKQDLPNVCIVSYAAKYASSYYGPFRDAVGSRSAFAEADKREYQMDPANAREALREVALDLSEGADIVMVKPGLPYLDILAKVKHAFGVPTFAYQVSGEYSMLRAASERGWLAYEASLLESLLAMKRAGADAVLTYGAMDAAKKIQKKKR